MPFISAVSVSPGLCLGPVHVVRARLDAAPIWSIRAQEVEAEISRLDRAVESVTKVLERRRADVAAAVGVRDAGILRVQHMILQDPRARAALD
ncbi:MAG: phosphoenolpyruvate-utilizing N-terminal domain-containing protein [Planctomycetota bacterium]|nr:phosphoenolpyruvate-utilizing N-terminal domain-containing protein [Planctomycetota bacterium]